MDKKVIITLHTTVVLNLGNVVNMGNYKYFKGLNSIVVG